MATPLFHSSKPLSKTWLNRIFSIVYAAVVFVHLTRHFRQLIRSPTPITVVLFVADFVLAFLWLTSQCFHWSPIERKAMYESMKLRVEAMVKSGVISLDRGMDSELTDAFSKWTPNFTHSQHPTVIQSLLDSGVDKDVEGGVMPNLIYVTREKRNNKSHNYKAGALNVMVLINYEFKRNLNDCRML
nr:cellulose synthase-like protein G3 [Tanacetum cinerariifolium]